MIALSLKRSLTPHLAAAFMLIYSGLLICFLKGFFHWNINLYAGLLLAPFICRVERGTFSVRYLLPAIATICLGILLPVKSVFFLALLFSALLLMENSIGKLSPAFLFLLLLISPVFKSFLGMVDFPVRLWLTGRVAGLLDANGVAAIAAGNQIQMGNYDFSVDPACAGLHMLIISLVICLFLLTQRQQARQAGFFLTSIAVLIAIGLNIISNFFRILLLVMFKIMPGTLLHDVVGIACLLIYVILPLFFVIKWLMTYFGQPVAAKASAPRFPPAFSIRYPALQIVAAAFLIFIASKMVTADALVSSGKNIQISGFRKTRLETGILKLERKTALIYLKPAAFYIPGHDPKLCWAGSGYIFKNIKSETLAGYEVYTAILQKGKDKIHAAWWFDNGTLKTVNQMTWRWQAAKSGDNFYLVNVNALNRAELEKQAIGLLNNTKYLK
ncbi:MAG TPA: exosortase N [Pedobacter sp.]|uniref:exosortase N n=1 Tax=Pedobacter sp. TaxID=1411316 RepID=UPI002D1185E3|nr:exosortase N [Pedobacter sp.]HMI01014.1 exosortase N [Pedobacter sp.]